MSDLLKRIGVFKISRDLIKESPEGVIDILKNILVIEITSDFLNDILIYKGCSKHFDLLDIGEPVPDYIATINKGYSGDTNFQKLLVKWNRQK